MEYLKGGRGILKTIYMQIKKSITFSNFPITLLDHMARKIHRLIIDYYFLNWHVEILDTLSQPLK